MAHKEEFKHDPVREFIAKSVEFIRENKKYLLQYGPLVVLAVLFLAYTSYRGETRETEANVQFGRALNLFIDGQTDIALLDFQAVVDEFSNTTSADYARLYLMQEAYKSGDDARLDEYLDALESADDKVIRAAVSGMKGNLAMDNDDPDAALQHMKAAKKLCDSPSIRHEYELGIIRAIMLKGNYENAVELGENLLETEGLKFNIKNELEDLLAEAKVYSAM